MEDNKQKQVVSAFEKWNQSTFEPRLIQFHKLILERNQERASTFQTYRSWFLPEENQIRETSTLIVHSLSLCRTISVHTMSLFKLHEKYRLLREAYERDKIPLVRSHSMSTIRVHLLTCGFLDLFCEQYERDMNWTYATAECAFKKYPITLVRNHPEYRAFFPFAHHAKYPLIYQIHDQVVQRICNKELRKEDDLIQYKSIPNWMYHPMLQWLLNTSGVRTIIEQIAHHLHHIPIVVEKEWKPLYQQLSIIQQSTLLLTIQTIELILHNPDSFCIGNVTLHFIPESASADYFCNTLYPSLIQKELRRFQELIQQTDLQKCIELVENELKRTDLQQSIALIQTQIEEYEGPEVYKYKENVCQELLCYNVFMDGYATIETVYTALQSKTDALATIPSIVSLVRTYNEYLMEVKHCVDTKTNEIHVLARQACPEDRNDDLTTVYYNYRQLLLTERVTSFANHQSATLLLAWLRELEKTYQLSLSTFVFGTPRAPWHKVLDQKITDYIKEKQYPLFPRTFFEQEQEISTHMIQSLEQTTLSDLKENLERIVLMLRGLSKQELRKDTEYKKKILALFQQYTCGVSSLTQGYLLFSWVKPFFSEFDMNVYAKWVEKYMIATNGSMDVYNALFETLFSFMGRTVNNGTLYPWESFQMCLYTMQWIHCTSLDDV